MPVRADRLFLWPCAGGRGAADFGKAVGGFGFPVGGFGFSIAATEILIAATEKSAGWGRKRGLEERHFSYFL